MEDTAQQQQIARSATLVSVGSVLSRVMGLAREGVIADVFGASGAVSAFTAASNMPFQLYDMLVGGMISSALVPTLSEYATPERRGELWRVASLLFTLAALVLGAALLVLELGAPWLSSILVEFDSPFLQAETLRVLRILLVSVFFLGLSGMATALCHALQRFALPAFTAVVFNASIVVVTLILGPRWVDTVQNPTIQDVQVGDLVAGRTIRQPDGSLVAQKLAVLPSGVAQEDLLGRVITIEEGVLTVDGEAGEFEMGTNESTLFRVQRRQVRTLALGLVLGAALQVALQLPALRDMRFRPILDLRHPLLQHILRLYAPVVLSIAVASIGVLIDRNLASRTGERSMAWMRYATTLIQFPLGLVSVAIATVILPTLARQAAQENGEPGASGVFRATFASGLRLVLFLTVPAAVGLLVLAHPLVALLFEHGDFASFDTTQTALALRIYAIGLTFAAVDQPLIFAFYARKDTWRPAMVGILAVGFYLAVALPTYRALGMAGLILANGAQLAGHAVVMTGLFARRVGTLRGYGIVRSLLQSLFAAAVMGGAVYGATQGVASLLAVEGRLSWLVTVVVGGGVGLGTYLAVCALLRVRELDLARSLAQQLILKVQGRTATALRGERR